MSMTRTTELAKSLAKFLFDSPDAMLRLDASEYSEKHTVAKLLGAPAGYVGYNEGGLLTEFVRRKPYSVVLVDELEKASREFVQVFLQVLDDGRVTDAAGRVVNFKNTGSYSLCIQSSSIETIGSPYFLYSDHHDLESWIRLLERTSRRWFTCSRLD